MALALGDPGSPPPSPPNSCETLDCLIPRDFFSKAETVTSSQDARFKKGLGLEGTACLGTPLSLHLLGLQGLSRRVCVPRAGAGKSVLGARLPPANSTPTWRLGLSGNFTCARYVRTFPILKAARATTCIWGGHCVDSSPAVPSGHLPRTARALPCLVTVASPPGSQCMVRQE